MLLHAIDWVILAAFFLFTLIIGLSVARQAGKSQADFFLSGRGMPWWLLGSSMVATTFAADTPLLVTGIVRANGVAGNWVWWAFLLTGMLTVAVFAKLWRRSNVLTDMEYYELRYSGRPAAFLRGFRSVYLGLIFNVITMANVTLAAVKIGHIMFGFTPLQTILVAAVVTVVFSAAGGLTSVLLTDFVLFIVAMIGSIGAAVVAVQQPEVGGLKALFEHPAVQGKIALWPSFDLSTTEALNTAMTILIVPLFVQWWASWYPGAEPGGGGYIAQRMLAARNEAHATGATLLFNFAHYALRPWPWVLVALASMIVFPHTSDLQAAFPNVPSAFVRDDLAYPALLARLPAGLLGLVTTSLVAAYMSTISTQLNWGASYLSNDVWLRFLRPGASQRELVWVGRVTTVLLMVLAGGLALQMESVNEGFNVLLQVGAGTGMIYMLRWFWWRMNAIAEIVAMFVSFTVAVGFFLLGRFARQSAPPDWAQFLIIVAVTTVCWALAAWRTPPDDDATLRRFYRRVRPGGPGWAAVLKRAHEDGELLDCDARWDLGGELIFTIAGCTAIYSTLFATGFVLYGAMTSAAMAGAVAVLASLVLLLKWRSVAGSNAANEPPPPPADEAH